MKARIWTVPNQITFLRLGFLPLFLILILYEEYRWALLVLVCAALTDAVDGLLARRLHQKSALGASRSHRRQTIALFLFRGFSDGEKDPLVADDPGAEPRCAD